MKLGVVRGVSRDPTSKQIVASEWWALVPKSTALATFAQHSLFVRAGKVDPAKNQVVDGVPCVAYYFGSHDRGALCAIWRCFQQAEGLR